MITRSLIDNSSEKAKVKVVVKAPGLSPMQTLSGGKTASNIFSPPLNHEDDQPSDSPPNQVE